MDLVLNTIHILVLGETVLANSFYESRDKGYARIWVKLVTVISNVFGHLANQIQGGNFSKKR